MVTTRSRSMSSWSEFFPLDAVPTPRAEASIATQARALMALATTAMNPSWHWTRLPPLRLQPKPKWHFSEPQISGLRSCSTNPSLICFRYFEKRVLQAKKFHSKMASSNESMAVNLIATGEVPTPPDSNPVHQLLVAFAQEGAQDAVASGSCAPRWV